VERARAVAVAAGLGLVLALIALVLPRGLVPPAAADITPTAGGMDLAGAIAGPGAVVTAAELIQSPLLDPDQPPPTEMPNAISDSQLAGFPTDGAHLAIMTTGDASAAGDQNTIPSEAPSEHTDAENQSLDLQRGNLRGNTDYDVSVLRIDLDVPPEANCLSFDFQFFSEEYPEWVGQAYNDAFIAELDVSTWDTAGSVITAPDNFAFAPDGPDEGEDPDVVSVNAVGLGGFDADEALGTVYDGATPLLSAATEITEGIHSLYLSIFDQGDHFLDSAVFLDNLRVGYVADPGTQCVPGAQVKQYQLELTPLSATLPVGEEHTVTATLHDLNADLPAVGGVELLFSVAGANPSSVPGDPVTDDDGTATYTFDGDNAGADAVSVCFDADESGACDVNEPFASATALWEPVVKPRVAFTDDRDETQLVEVTRQFFDHDSNPNTAQVEFFGGGTRELAGIRRARHTGEASPADFGDATYVSTVDDRHGEVYLSRSGEGGPAFGNESLRRRVTCDNDAVETHPVYFDDYLAYASDIDGDFDLYVARQADGTIPVDERVGGACGSWQAFQLTGLDDGKGDDDLWPSWAPNGNALVYSSTRDDPLGDIYRLWVDDGEPGEDLRQTDTPGVAESQPSAGEYHFEEWIAFTTTQFRPDGSIGVLESRFEEGEDLPLRSSAWPGGGQGSEPSWGGESADPNIAFTSTENDPYGDVWVADLVDPVSGVEVRPRFREAYAVADQQGVAESHPTWHSAFFDDDGSVDRPPPAWAQTGPPATAASHGPDGQLFVTVRSMDADVSDVLAVDGSQRRRIVHRGFGEGERFDEAGPDYSPDGTQIAFSSTVDSEGGGRELMTATADGDDPVSLAAITGRQLGNANSPGDVDSDPVWSPDGTRIAFVRQRIGPISTGISTSSIISYSPPQVWVASLTGEFPPFAVKASHANEFYLDTDPSWSPDGAFLVLARQVHTEVSGTLSFRRGGPGTSSAALQGLPRELWVVSSAPGSDDAVQLVHSYSTGFGSDGPEENFETEIVLGRSPAWSPDGTRIAYDDRGSLRLVTVDPAGPTTEDLDDRTWTADDPAAVTGFRDDLDDPDDPFDSFGPFDQRGEPTDSRTGATAISVAEDPAWSPDGLELAFAGQPAGQPDQRGIWAIAPDGSGLRMLTDLHPLDQHEDQPRDQDARGPETEPAWEPLPEADLAVSLTITGSPAAASAPFTATYVVVNNGPTPAQGVTLTTTVPPGGARQAVAPPAGCLADGSGCSLPGLDPGDTLTYEVQLSYPAELDGTASGTVASLTPDPVPGNNTASADFRVLPAPGVPADVAVTVTLDEPIGYVGGHRTATVTVTNLGPGTAEAVTLRTAYPDMVTPAADETCLVDGTPCALGDLAPEAEQVFTVDLTAVQAGTGPITARVATTTVEESTENNRARRRLEVKQPTIRLLPAVARPGQVVLAFGEDMPPGSRVTVDWEPGITVDTGPFRVAADGTMRASLLLVRRDRLGDRTLTATSVTDEFSPVTGEMLVVLRTMQPPDLVGRG
jgi:Tol biopolymer transport system component